MSSPFPGRTDDKKSLRHLEMSGRGISLNAAFATRLSFDWVFPSFTDSLLKVLAEHCVGRA